MNTYPQYPQPILSQPDGTRWYLEVSNGGSVAPKAIVIEPAWSSQRLTLVTPDRLNSYRLGLSGATPPTITTSLLPASFGGYEDITSFSPNGREWSISLDNSGNTSVSALSQEWPRMGVPVLEDPSRQPWRFEVKDGGVYQITLDPAEQRRQPVKLRSQDNTSAWQLTLVFDANGDTIINVSDIPLADAIFYEAELVSPSNERWALQVDQNGVLSMYGITDFINSREEWPLVLSDGLLYCLDNRFGRPRRKVY